MCEGTERRRKWVHRFSRNSDGTEKKLGEETQFTILRNSEETQKELASLMFPTGLKISNLYPGLNNVLNFKEIWFKFKNVCPLHVWSQMI